MRVLVTGANGFIGQTLCRRLCEDEKHEVVAAVRGGGNSIAGITHLSVGDIHSQTTWKHALGGVDVVVHLAGRAHVMRDTHIDPLAGYRAINTDGTLNAARQAVAAGVRRFIYLSSIKVCGEGQSLVSEAAYDETQLPAPSDAYAISKLEAEKGLKDIAKTTGLEVVILRPPLVYGPGVTANFLRLMRMVDRGWPLPLGAVNNRRDLIYLGNLVDAIATCITHVAAANKTFLLADGDDVSTPELIRRLSDALGCPARLLPMPEHGLRIAGILTGKSMAVNRLLGSLMVDSSAIRQDLDWSPLYSMREGLLETVKWYRCAQNNRLTNSPP